MGLYRIERLNVQLRDEIAKLILHGDIKDYRVSEHLTINRVEVTQDLSYAKVYVSTFLSDEQLEKGVEGLNSAAGFIQSQIAAKMRIRKFPRMTFVVDSAMKDGFKMVNKLNELEEETKAWNIRKCWMKTRKKQKNKCRIQVLTK